MSEHQHTCNSCYRRGGVIDECLECGGSGRVTYSFSEQELHQIVDFDLKPRKNAFLAAIEAMKEKKG